ncbi:sensor histidine kinase [Enhygromyxa salina]|uniref:sensor histidine kinase n=1 Tax=Enhygromyxa salina TaxID=215803 RepID=UPI0011B26421|nr:ATP-binding protein [Enhygromyxa salina]
MPRKTAVTGSHVLLPSAIPARRLLAAVGLAALAHLLSSWGLLQLLIHGQAWLDTDLSGSLLLVVSLTGVAALITADLARRRGIDQATRTAPAVFGLLPPFLSVAIGLPWVWAGSTLEFERALLSTVPLLAATTAPGLGIALTLEHALSAVAVRLGEADALARRATGGLGPIPRRGRLEPPTLTGRLVRLVVGLAVATCLLVLAHAIVQSNGAQNWGESWFGYRGSWMALLGVTAVVIIAVLAAASAGLSPGRDVQALATRLDAIGWDDAAGTSMAINMAASADARPLASSVRITSFDAVGDLFSNLERLRARLAEDVGTYQRALDRTHEADASKREFLAAVSHELRTPLNSIRGFAQLLLETELTESQAEDVRLILAGGQQLQDLIEDILDLSMIESGELELRFAACDVGELVEQIVDIHRSQVRERGVELAADIQGEIPPVVCDAKRIGQVVTNLLSNAIKFTEAGRVGVRVRYEPRRGTVAIAVADTGVGIAADELGAIFEEYQQVGATKRKQRGTGLGLAIARRIAAAHGGSLSAKSRLEVGSTFTLRLPLEAALDDDSVSQRGLT